MTDMRYGRLSTLCLAGALVGVLPAFAGWDEGVAAFKAKNYSQAATEFEGVVNGRPDWAGGYLMLGRTQLLLNHAAEAVTTLRKGYDLSPSDVQLQLYLSQAYLASRRASEAAQLLGKINPAGLPREQQAFYQQLYGKALSDSGQTDRAASALAKAAAASPNDADIQYQYGALAFNAGDLDAAVAALDKATRLDPKDPAKQKLYVQALVRQARSTGGSSKDALYTRAVDPAKALVARDPSYDNLLLLGETQLGANQYDGAVSTFGQATAKNGSDWLPYYYIGQAQTVQQKFNDAETSLKRALDRAGTTSDKSKVWKQLAFVYEKEKNYDAAARAYESAGDSAGATRARENQKIAESNKQADAEQAKLDEIRKAQEELKKKLQQQQQGGPPPLP
jgi:predicted Zn-dependent protease